MKHFLTKIFLELVIFPALRMVSNLESKIFKILEKLFLKFKQNLLHHRTLNQML